MKKISINFQDINKILISLHWEFPNSTGGITSGGLLNEKIRASMILKLQKVRKSLLEKYKEITELIDKLKLEYEFEIKEDGTKIVKEGLTVEEFEAQIAELKGEEVKYDFEFEQIDFERLLTKPDGSDLVLDNPYDLVFLSEILS